MKKLFTILALALAVVACQKDGAENVSNDDLALVTLNVTAPELGVTRADVDGTADTKYGHDSAYGAIDYADDAFWAKYDLRYILDVYGEDGKEVVAKNRIVKYSGKYDPANPVKFELRLVPNRTYKFVVWADFVLEGTQKDLYYDTANLAAITAITGEDYTAMNEARDAYYKSQDIYVTTMLNENIVLKRPFAKMRVVTNDILDICKYEEATSVTVSYYSDLSQEFNAVTGKVNMGNHLSKTEYSVTYATAESKYTEGVDKDPDSKTLYADYLFTDATATNQQTINFVMDVYGKSGELIKSNDFSTSIPIASNHLTTIYGNLLTTQANVYVYISDEFDSPFFDENLSDDDFVNIVNAEVENNKIAPVDGKYSIPVTSGDSSYDIVVAKALEAGTYNYSEHFTVENFKYAVPQASTFATRAAATVDVEDVTGGKMIVTEKATANNTTEYTIVVMLDFKYTDNGETKIATTKDRIVSELEFTNIPALATPVVAAAVEGNVVTLTWAVVEGASHYTVQVDDDVEEVVEATSYVFEGDYEVEYTFTVKAIAADTTVNTDSEATVVKATTEAKPEVKPVALATPVVEADVEGNVVTLTWAAVENAAKYSVTVGTEMPVFVEETTYVFTGEYETEYTFNVVAVPADEEKFAVSEAGVVTVTTEAKPEQPVEKVLTVAEFLALTDVVPSDANADVIAAAPRYTLTGTITGLYGASATTYGNFYLNDGTGEVLIYGLVGPDGESKYWATSGAKVGDDITVKTIRTEYGNSPQGKNATFVEVKTPGTLAFWSFSKTAVTFVAAGGQEVITVDAYNTTENITVVSDNEQFTAAYADGALTITAKENTSTEPINGNITVTTGALEQVITVVQGGVSVGGTEVTAEAVMADQGWANKTIIKDPVKLNDDVVVTFAQGKAGTAPTYYTTGNAVRLYQNGATMTVSANGKTIKSMEITFADGHYYMAPDCGEFSAEGDVRVWTGEATEVKFTTTGTDKDHRAYIAAIKVTYVD